MTDVYAASLGEEGRLPAFRLCMDLRKLGVKADCDHMERSLKAQFRYADKIGARLIAILGGDELQRGAIRIKNMSSGEEAEYPLDSAAETIRGMLA